MYRLTEIHITYDDRVDKIIPEVLKLDYDDSLLCIRYLKSSSLVNQIRKTLIEKYPEFFVKVTVYSEYDITSYLNEVKVYSIVKDNRISPTIHHQGTIATCEVFLQEEDFNITSRKYFITYLVMDKCGTSLDILYLPNNIAKNYLGPGCYIQRNGRIDDFESYFPQEYFPTKVVQGVLETLHKLKNLGVYHEDIHPGNFLEHNGEILVIDFECITIR